MDNDNGATNPIEVQKYLKGMDYPANKQAIMDMAKKQSAPEKVVKLIERLPDKSYNTPADLAKELGGK